MAFIDSSSQKEMRKSLGGMVDQPSPDVLPLHYFLMLCSIVEGDGERYIIKVWLVTLQLLSI